MFTEHLCITCNRNVEPIESISPVYDDGGSIDSMDIEVEYPEECWSCRTHGTKEMLADMSSGDIDLDDLPF